MSNTTTRELAPAGYVIQDSKGTYFATYDWDEGKPIGTRDPALAYFTTDRQAAEAMAELIRGTYETTGGRPYEAIIKCRKAQTETVITDEGRAAVAARRAARKAERGW